MRYKGILIGTGIGFLFAYFLVLIQGTFMSYLDWNPIFIKSAINLVKEFFILRIALITSIAGGFVGFMFQD